MLHHPIKGCDSLAKDCSANGKRPNWTGMEEREITLKLSRYTNTAQYKMEERGF